MSSNETSSDDGETSHNLNIKKKKIAGRRRVRNAARNREKIIAQQNLNTCQQAKGRAAETPEKKIAQQKLNTCQQAKGRAAETPEKKIAELKNRQAKYRAAKTPEKATTPEQIINVVELGIKY